MSAVSPAQDGKMAPPAGGPPQVDKSGWSAAEAYPGDPVFLVAKLSGFMPGTPVEFKIFPASGDPGKPIAQAKGTSDARGIAWARWAYEKQGAGLKDPNLVFEATAKESKAISPALTISDWVLFDLADEDQKPLKQKMVRVVDSLGMLHLGVTNDHGQLKLKKVPMGDLTLAVRGYEVVGEKKPGDKKYASGKQHNVDLRELKFEVAIDSPKQGDVYLAGEKVPLKTTVKRVGKPHDGRAKITANNGAKVEGGAGAGQSAGGAVASEEFLILPGKDGEVEVQAKYESAITTVKIKVVKPVVTSIEFQGDDTYKVFDHKAGAEAFGRAKFDAKGDATEQLPGAFKMGKKITAKVVLSTAQALTRPAKVELALTTPPIEEGPPAPNERRMPPRPLVLRLPEDKRAAGVELKGGEKGAELILESDRPLPFMVQSWQWDLAVRLNTKAGEAWSMSPDNAPVWPKAGDLRGVRLNAVWGPATIAEGKELDPATVPLKKSEYDPFHLRRACEWAAGGKNLLMNDDKSIVKLLVENMRAYRWPDDYHWLRGKPRTDHPRPTTAADRAEAAGDPTKAGNEATAKNWGLGVLDHPQNPGGRPNQWASAAAAYLAVLGVKTKILYLRPRGEGAVNTLEHDPVTKGATCFDEKRHWGKPYLAFTGVEVDKSRDQDQKGVKLHEDELFVIEAVSKKRALMKDAATTTHEKKPSDPSQLLSNQDKCGRDYAQVTTLHFPGKLTYTVNAGQFSLPEQTLKLAQGEVTVEMAVPAAMYGAEDLLPNPYGGAVTLNGGGKSIVKQMAAIRFTKDGGLLKGKVDLGEVAPGDYKLGLTAFFQRIPHNPRFNNATFNGAGDVTVHAVAPGSPRPETTVDAVHQVGKANGGQLTAKSTGKLAVMLVEGQLTNYYTRYGHRSTVLEQHAPVETLLVSVDGGAAKPLARGQLVELGPVKPGEHKLVFSNARAYDNWAARVRVVAVTVDEKARVRANPLTGAQPDWGYKSAATGKPVSRDATKDDAGHDLKAPFAESIIYLCPGCKKTVHDGDAECWSCGAKLTARKAADRFGQPQAPTASGGDGGKTPGQAAK